MYMCSYEDKLIHVGMNVEEVMMFCSSLVGSAMNNMYMAIS